MEDSFIQAKFYEPILFRTCDREVYGATLNTGSLWLRSNTYYQQIEDAERQDRGEGVSATRLGLPIRLKNKSGMAFEMRGEGSVGQLIVPHYIVSLHGLGIKEKIHQGFGGHTLGVRCLADLAAEVLYQASLQIQVNGYRYGQVAYQHTALMLKHAQDSQGAATSFGDVALGSINTDVLRKDPIEPFVGQDEWRIALFTDGYLNDDPMQPLKINVDPGHFYEYLD